jgi:DnaJ-domain-containing protein 1
LFDQQTLVLIVIFAVGFGAVWFFLDLRGMKKKNGANAGSGAVNRDWYAVLGVSPQAAFEEIEAAYRARKSSSSGEDAQDIDWAFSKARHLRGK